MPDPTSTAGSVVADALATVAALPGVPEGIEAARQACTALRWHEALRRRTAEAQAEASVRAARASAVLAGGRLPLGMVRDIARGAAQAPPDVAGRVVLGALRATTEAARLASGPGGTRWEAALGQALARLHMAAAAGLVVDEALGRPRRAGEDPGDGADLLLPDGSVLVPVPGGAPLAARLGSMADLVAAPGAPVLVVAGLVHAELASLRPFLAGNGVVARAVCRALLTGRGLDPTGVGVWEEGLLAAGPRYPLALARYATGTPDGVADWLVLFAGAVVDGAAEGRSICDAVRAGRLTPPA